LYEIFSDYYEKICWTEKFGCSLILFVCAVEKQSSFVLKIKSVSLLNEKDEMIKFATTTTNPG